MTATADNFDFFDMHEREEAERERRKEAEEYWNETEYEEMHEDRFRLE